MLGIEYPIIAAPMGPDLSGVELVAAVSNAGGLGILQAQFCSPLQFREEIRRVRALTRKPFGVNLLLHFPVEDHVAVCLEERVPVLSFFWGDATPYVQRAHSAGVKSFTRWGPCRRWSRRPPPELMLSSRRAEKRVGTWQVRSPLWHWSPGSSMQ